MNLYIGIPFTGRQMLFASWQHQEAPRAVRHDDGGFFRRHNATANFACDRCGAAVRLPITDGVYCDPSRFVAAITGEAGSPKDGWCNPSTGVVTTVAEGA